jgi:hypothetical protein
VRSIAASSPLSTFATLGSQSSHSGKKHITPTHHHHAEEKGRQGAGQGKAKGQGTERPCYWETSMDEEVCQKLR